MFPNPQDALPLPPRPELARYRELAEQLVQACRSGEPGAVEAWARRWIESLARSCRPALEFEPKAFERSARNVEDFARRTLTTGERACERADAQATLARSHGFRDWPTFAAHVEALARPDSETARFEAAADALVTGDVDALERLLRAAPELLRSRSSREHRATLLHYVSANGVETYRQRTPPNAARIAELLLDAGADVDAEADVYGGGCTTLGLVASSTPPRRAGVQNALMQVLLDHGADVNHPDMLGNSHGTIAGCLANGCVEAGSYLAERGARVGLAEAAGIGRLDLVKTFFDERGAPKPGVTSDAVHAGLFYACGYGFADVVLFLLDRGADPATVDGDRQTALHHAAMGGRHGLVRILIERGAPLEARNVYGGTVLGQALWSAAHAAERGSHARVVEALLSAGARVPKTHPPIDAEIDALLARHGSFADPVHSWFGEEPRAS